MSFWALFCPFTTPTYSPHHHHSHHFHLIIPKIKILKKKKKMKRMPGHIILLTYKCTINEDHMIYGPWNIRWDRQKFSLFWDISSPFSPLKTWKIKILTLKKTPGYIIILHICTVNDNHMMYSSWHMEQDRHNFL